MNDTPNLPGFITPMIRQVLALAFGVLIGKGVFTADQAEAVIGGLLALLPVAWALFSRHATREALKDAIAAPAGMARPLDTFRN